MQATVVQNTRTRGFEVVSDHMRKHPTLDIQLPIRNDKGSAGYDLRTPVKVVLKPNERVIIFTDIKAYMQEEEVLEIHVRSSIGTEKGIVLSNIVAIIDSSYYNSIKTGGNIGLTLWNTSSEVQTLEADERVCQCIFKKYLTTDDDKCLNEERTGGFGSSGKF